MDVRMLTPPGLRGQVDEFLRAVIDGESVEHMETVRVRKNGDPIDVSVTISPIRDRDGRVTGASAIARDITGLKRAQRTVEEREARIRLLLDSTAAVRHGARTARALAAAAALAATAALPVVDRAAGGVFAALLPWAALHAALLLGLLYAPGAARRGVQPAIVCALSFILWFVAGPLWQLAR
jgi:hypothetical protein